MLKIEFSIVTAAEADLAARISAAIAAEFGAGPAVAPMLASSVSVPATLPRRGRPPKADPVAAYVEAAGSLPVVEPEPVVEEPAADPVPDNAPAEILAAEAAFVPEPPAASTQSRDDMLIAVRGLAQTRGALWLRALFESASRNGGVIGGAAAGPAKKLSDITDEHLAAALAAEAAS